MHVCIHLLEIKAQCAHLGRRRTGGPGVPPLREGGRGMAGGASPSPTVFKGHSGIGYVSPLGPPPGTCARGRAGEDTRPYSGVWEKWRAHNVRPYSLKGLSS